MVEFFYRFIILIICVNVNAVLSNNTISETIEQEDELDSKPYYITSPNYPNNYPKNLQAEYNLQALPDFDIHIKFQAFHLEEPLKSGQCLYDNLTMVYADSNQAFQVACGDQSNDLPSFNFLPISQKIKFIFKSDSSYQFKGFNISISFTKKDSVIRDYFDITSNEGGNLDLINYKLQNATIPSNYFLKIDMEVEVYTCIGVSLVNQDDVFLHSCIEEIQISYLTPTSKTVHLNFCPEMNNTQLQIYQSKITIDISNLQHKKLSLIFTSIASDDCMSAQDYLELNISQVGLWIVVSVSSIIVICFFIIQGGVKHCRENRLCCYDEKKKLGSRRGSSATFSTPKSTKVMKTYDQNHVSKDKKDKINAFNAFNKSNVVPRVTISSSENQEEKKLSRMPNGNVLRVPKEEINEAFDGRFDVDQSPTEDYKMNGKVQNGKVSEEEKNGTASLEVNYTTNPSIILNDDNNAISVKTTTDIPVIDPNKLKANSLPIPTKKSKQIVKSTSLNKEDYKAVLSAVPNSNNSFLHADGQNTPDVKVYKK